MFKLALQFCVATGLVISLWSCQKEPVGFQKFQEPPLPPQARFEVWKIENCQPPYTLYFRNTSFDTLGAENYTWQFGDGVAVNSDEEYVQHRYSAAGEYMVKLKVENVVDSNVFSNTLSLPEKQTIVADFDYFSGHADTLTFWAPCRVHFLNRSRYATFYDWRFGNGESAKEENPVASYYQEGQYEVTLTSLCADQVATSTKTVNISPPPTTFKIQHVIVTDIDYSREDSSDTQRGLEVYAEITLGGQEKTSLTKKRIRRAKDLPFELFVDEDFLVNNYNQRLRIRIMEWDDIDDDDLLHTEYVELEALKQAFYPTEYQLPTSGDVGLKLQLQWSGE